MIKGYIVVGVDSKDKTRTNEYNPFKSDGTKVDTDQGGKGAQYSEFIVKTLKPYIDEHYRTLPDKPNTTIIGSSYGAVSALYTAIQYNDVFGNVGAFSFCDNVNSTAMTVYLKSKFTRDAMSSTKVYCYSGTNDFAYDSTSAMARIAYRNHVPYILMDEDTGTHN